MSKQTTTRRMTSKYQATIPPSVRRVLGLQAGNTVAFEIESGRVRLRKAGLLDIHFARAVEGTLASEWLSTNDEAAYREL